MIVGCLTLATMAFLIRGTIGRGRNVKVRLDQGLGDKFFIALGESQVFHIPLAELDHCGLLVEVRKRALAGRRPGCQKPKPFRYENMWKSHGDYMDFVA